MKYLSVILLYSILMSACKKEKLVSFEDSLKGNWKQTEYDTTAHQYNITNVTLGCNEIILETRFQTDSLNPQDSCSEYNWTDKIVGAYFVKTNEIFVQGFYKEENGENKLTGCHGTGYFEHTFTGKIFNDRLILTSDEYNYPLTLKSKIDC
jgi:hypothetical protein